MDLVFAKQRGTASDDRLAKSVSQKTVDERIDARTGVRQRVRDDLVRISQFGAREVRVEFEPYLESVDRKPEDGEQQDDDGDHLARFSSLVERVKLLETASRRNAVYGAGKVLPNEPERNRKVIFLCGPI